MIAFVGKTVTPCATFGISRRLNPVEYPHQLFPCHWGAIVKELLVDEGEKPEWATIRYKIQATDLDRIFASEDTLIGVRFGKLTKYLVIDIDIRSLCHPEVNKNEWNRLMKALEEVGLTDRIIIQSSDSGGLHVYFWFGEELETYKVAQLLWSVCHSGGFELRGGNVETFPNAKKYTLIPSMYNGHRLPLQPESGSILLDEYFEEIETINPWGEFCYQVQTSQQDMELLKKKLRWGVRYHRKHARYQGSANLCNSAADWQKSLIDRLNLGWTSQGQTNELIRTACVLAWVFGDGSRNDAAIVEKLVNMPGYKEFCGHQHEIEKRVADWMDCATKQYWPYCRPDMRPFASMRNEQPTAEKPPSTKLHDDVMDRLRQVVAAVIDQPLPKKISEIIQLIQETAKEMFGKGFGINTLYSSRYAPEWRILVEKAQSHIQRVFSQSLGEPESTKKQASNPETESVFSEFVSMKVAYAVKILVLDFLLALERGIDSAIILLTDRSGNLEFETRCSIETDKFISFTNGCLTPGASPEAISRPNQSSSAQPRLFGVDEQFGDGVDRASWGLLQDTCKNLQNSLQSHMEEGFYLDDFDSSSMDSPYLEAIEEPEDDDDWQVIYGYGEPLREQMGIAQSLLVPILEVTGEVESNWNVSEAPWDLIAEEMSVLEGFSNSNSKFSAISLSEVYAEAKPVNQAEVKEFSMTWLRLRAWLITVMLILSIMRSWFSLMVLRLCLGGRLGIFF